MTEAVFDIFLKQVRGQKELQWAHAFEMARQFFEMHTGDSSCVIACFLETGICLLAVPSSIQRLKLRSLEPLFDDWMRQKDTTNSFGSQQWRFRFGSSEKPITA